MYEMMRARDKSDRAMQGNMRIHTKFDYLAQAKSVSRTGVWLAKGSVAPRISWLFYGSRGIMY